MDQFRIDRLALHVPGLSEADGARLGRLVADGLDALEIPAGATSAPSLRVDLRARAGDSIEALAARVVAEIARRLGRASGQAG